jgi:hypothetical protein
MADSRFRRAMILALLEAEAEAGTEAVGEAETAFSSVLMVTGLILG